MGILITKRKQMRKLFIRTLALALHLQFQIVAALLHRFLDAGGVLSLIHI